MKLSVIKNLKVVQVLELDPEIEFPQVYLVGRSPHCHIVLNDASLSREQGQFTLEKSKLAYKDLSTGQVQSIENNQAVKLGAFEIRFENPKEISNEVSSLVINDLNKNNENFELEEKFQDKKVNDQTLISENNFQEAPVIENEIEIKNVNDNALENVDFNEEMIKETFSLPESVSTEQIKVEEEKSQLDSLPMQQAEDDATRVISDFVQYELYLSGVSVPFEKYQISKNETTVGRNQKADIVLDDQEVSSFHAKFILKNNSLIVEDTDSVNGIVVNGKKVNKQTLAEGDTVNIGNTTFKVSVLSEFIEGEKNILMPVDVYSDDKTQEFSLDELASAPHEGKKSIENEKGKRANADFLKELFSKIPIDQIKNNKRRIILYGAMSILLILLFLPQSENNNQEVVNIKNEDSSKNINKENPKSIEDVKQVEKDSITQKPAEVEKSQEELNYLNSHYALAMSYIEKGDYVSAISEIDLILKVDQNFKDVSSLYGIAKDGLAKVEEEERKRKEEEERIARKKEIDDLIVKIEESMKERNLSTSEMYISQVMAIDPENLKVSALKLEIDAIKEDIKKRAEEEAIKKELRAKMVSRLAPGKSFYHQREWFKAIIKLNDFLSSQGNDEDLIKDASQMLDESKKGLDEQIAGPLEKARQYKVSQDLKNAYENYNEVLKVYPTHEESLVSAREIKEVLMSRAKVIFRQALVSESISHFRKAKEKFQEVLLIAPSDSEYYKKAEDKLKKIYLE